MPATLAFDVYGTLIDVHGVVSELEKMIGNNAQAFSRTWREKQLEYSFRRGLMQHYEPFSVCTRQALDYTCLYHKMDLTGEQKNHLLERYRSLPAFADVTSSLERLKEHGFRLFAFSNGTAEAINGLLVSAGIKGYFQDSISVDELKSFKPNPAVYSHFLRRADVKANNAWLISSNPFDVIGAISAGMCGAWVNRSNDTIYDPWGIDPTITVESLDELHEKLHNN